jgi:p-hydroxybenzoate 3-monooxygenase
MAQAAPPSEELIYSGHENGFALYSMRSPILSRLYIQCRPDEDINQWSDRRIWDELHLRLGDLGLIFGERGRNFPALSAKGN